MLLWRILPIILLSISISTDAQFKKFAWEMGDCSYEGFYDSTKVTKAQLENTLKLGFLWYSEIEAEDIPYNTKIHNYDSLDKEYHTDSTILTTLNIVKMPYWERLRKRKLIEIEKVYRLKKVTMEAYSTPCILKEYLAPDSCGRRYADALCEGGDKLIDAWKELVDEQSKKNDPDMVRNDFKEEYDSPDRMYYAKTEVMTFGWWNHANDCIPYVENANENEYEKLFKKVKNLGCEGD